MAHRTATHGQGSTGEPWKVHAHVLFTCMKGEISFALRHQSSEATRAQLRAMEAAVDELLETHGRIVTTFNTAKARGLKRPPNAPWVWQMGLSRRVNRTERLAAELPALPWQLICMSVKQQFARTGRRNDR